MEAIRPEIKNNESEFSLNNNPISSSTLGAQKDPDPDFPVSYSVVSDDFTSINVTVDQYQVLLKIAKFLNLQISDMGVLMAEFFIREYKEPMQRLEELEAERDKILEQYRTPGKLPNSLD